MTFYQLCTASPAAFQAMQTCIDIHARQGKAYEFADCEMPAGCTPARAALGFLRQGESYTLYWRPMVDSFQSLSARLQSLRREVEPGSGLLRGRPLPRPERRGPLWEQQRQAASPETWPVLYRRLTEELSKAVLGSGPPALPDLPRSHRSWKVGAGQGSGSRSGTLLRKTLSVCLD